ncbi:hypothetical protein QQZ08_005317 [Neonectria magnoliae]|uniref:Zn(2)-C6 fungal-type domain-containing protein n=1 Tax=Neonectria magnoliae TaxID=2732573 RepID=A0ABR1I3H6_9HYPO
MDEDNTTNTPATAHSLQPSSSDTNQGTSGPQSQGNPTPTSVQSSNTPSNTPSNTSGSLANSHSKRRRGLGVVTPNACTECRKKRAKCDGQRPCGRCKGQKDIECVYEVPVRQSKENLRAEIENLRHRQRSNDQVFAALVRPEHWEEILTRLRGGQSVESVSEWLTGTLPSGGGAMPSFAQRPDTSSSSHVAGFPGGSLGSLAAMSIGVNPSQPQPPAVLTAELGRNSPWHFSSQSQAGSTRSNSHPDAMSWTADVRGPPQSQVGSWADDIHPDHLSDGLPRFRGLEQVLSPLNDPDLQAQSTTWTSITGDINLVQHLLALYFCWEYPTFASLSKEHFLQDFQDGRHRYCSPILLNALLALGCRFSTQPMTRANPNDPYSSGDHFFKESQRLFHQETDHHNLTTIQALGIMSIREASCGRDSESWYYAGQSIRLAIEMGLHRIQGEGDEDELAVQAATFWGAFALDQPLIKLRIIGSKVSPRDVCSQAADAIQGLLKSYSQLYTLRRTPSFVPYFVLTSAIMHLAIGAANVQSSSDVSVPDRMETAAKIDPHVKDSIRQGIDDLTEMAPCHRFAEQALNILRHLAQKWDIDVDINGDTLTPEEYDRLVKPKTGSLNFFAPNMREADIMCQWGTGKTTAGGDETPSVTKTADSMENPLFWPFPMQGRPILPDGKELEDAGFAMF